MKAPLSLKGRAIALLAQREHSETELRRKLQRWASAEGAGEVSAGDADMDELAARVAARIDELVAWLNEHDYLSDERFVESRVHARAARFGNLRIRQELAQHGLAMSAQATQSLKDSELQRAAEVWRRKFGSPAATPAERARQSRFLAARGFSGEVIGRVMRRSGHIDQDDAA